MATDDGQDQRVQQILWDALKFSGSRGATSAWALQMSGPSPMAGKTNGRSSSSKMSVCRALGSAIMSQALLFAFVAGILIFSIAGCEQKSARAYQLHVLFHTVHQLKVGDPVKMAGIHIGRVQSIALDPTNHMWHVTMRVNRSAVVKIDSVAAIPSGASPGESFIALDAGSPSGVAATHGTYLMNIETPTAKEAALAIDVGCENLLKAQLGLPPDALKWAERNPKTFPDGATLESMLTSLSDAGARRMIVITNLPSYDYLIILTLPSDAALRQKVFTRDARFRQVCGLEPTKDCGQRYLAYSFVKRH